ncbi:hypothetical protein MRX96_053925 [Rhipicephalus microplus]
MPKVQYSGRFKQVTNCVYESCKSVPVTAPVQNYLPISHISPRQQGNKILVRCRTNDVKLPISPVFRTFQLSMYRPLCSFVEPQVVCFKSVFVLSRREKLRRGGLCTRNFELGKWYSL